MLPLKSSLNKQFIFLLLRTQNAPLFFFFLSLRFSLTLSRPSCPSLSQIVLLSLLSLSILSIISLSRPSLSRPCPSHLSFSSSSILRVLLRISLLHGSSALFGNNDLFFLVCGFRFLKFNVLGIYYVLFIC